MAKIENLLSSDYPRARSEILIGDDGSTDETAAIARLFASQGVKLISLAAQQGKSAVQNRLAVASSGDVLVFTDADCLIPRGALQSLVQHFSDPRVGLVTARPRFVNERETSVAANEGPISATRRGFELGKRPRHSRHGFRITLCRAPLVVAAA